VDIWVNGGWDQPNCGVVGDPPAIRQLSRSKGVEGKKRVVNSIIELYVSFVYQHHMA
jgi:hypothetical protein